MNLTTMLIAEHLQDKPEVGPFVAYNPDFEGTAVGPFATWDDFASWSLDVLGLRGEHVTLGEIEDAMTELGWAIVDLWTPAPFPALFAEA